MSRQSELAALGRVSDTSALSNRNLIINGAMQVAQRGTSQTVGGYGSVDRWYIDNTADGGGQVADAPDDFEYSLKVNPNTGNATVRQAIELPAAGKGGVFRSGQTFTLSFWLKSDNAGEVINIFIASSTSVSGSTTTHVNDTSTGLTTSTSWTRYTYTYTQASNVGGSDTCYNIVPYVSSPSGAIYITGISLEVGDSVTPFEHRSYSDELARCQRYYIREDSSVNDYPLGSINGYCFSNTSFAAGYKAAPTMRTTPSISYANINIRGGQVDGNNTEKPVSSVSAISGNGSTVTFTVSTSSATLAFGAIAVLCNSGTSPSYIQFDAEL